MTVEQNTKEASALGAQQCIDWEESLRLAGGKEALARELLSMLVNDLPEMREQISKNFEAEDFLNLNRCVHRLHGASCYCGVPRIRKSTASLEAAIKNADQAAIPSLTKKVLFEIDQVIQYSQSDNYAVVS